MKLRKTAAGLAGVALAASMGATALAAPAGAAGYQTPDVSNQAPRPGSTITIVFHGYMPGEHVFVTLESHLLAGGEVVADSGVYAGSLDLGSFVADDAGDATATVTLPSDLAAGKYTLVGTGGMTGRTQSVEITVVAAGDDKLPFTGAEALPLLIGGGAALVAGAGFIVVSRKRREA